MPEFRPCRFWQQRGTGHGLRRRLLLLLALVRPRRILKLLDQLEVEPHEVIVLGDHHTDMLAARAAGINPIGISHGFGTPAELKNAGAVKIVDDIASIPRIIEAHNSGKSLLFKN